jgi:uncharacterized protein YjbJ (UPF0337 family)
MLVSLGSSGGNVMDKDQVEGEFKQMKGKAKDAWGDLTDNTAKKVEGKTDKVAGKIQEKYGDAKESLRRGMDRADAERKKIDNEKLDV